MGMEFVNKRRIVLFNSAGSMTFDYSHNVNLPHDMSSAHMMLRNAAESEDVYPVLVLEGGADINPEIYGEKNTHSHIGQWSMARDEREISLYNVARDHGIFVWGNCRGHQLIAALNGGTLYQDIDAAGFTSHGWTDHLLVPTNMFEEIRPVAWEVNSLHHQAIKRVPPNAVVCGVIGGLVEALWYPGQKMGSVQFHPEFMRDVNLLLSAVHYAETVEKGV